jgi:hypothetical protein
LRDCISNVDDIKYQNGYWAQLSTTVGQNPLPIYPTIDNQRCNARNTLATYKISNFDQQHAQYWNLFNNPDWNIMEDGSVIDRANYSKQKYNLYNSYRDQNGNLQRLQNIELTSTDVQLDNGCFATIPQNYCSGRGTYVQTCYAQDGATLVDCSSPQAYYKLNEGTCLCNTYVSSVDGTTKNYVGAQCQYDDNGTCNGHGTVSASGTCTCQNAWSGNNVCSLTSCQHGGTPNMYTSGSGCICPAAWNGGDTLCAKRVSIKLKGSGNHTIPQGVGFIMCEVAGGGGGGANGYYDQANSMYIGGGGGGSGAYGKYGGSIVSNTILSYNIGSGGEIGEDGKPTVIAVSSGNNNNSATFAGGKGAKGTLGGQGAALAINPTQSSYSGGIGGKVSYSSGLGTSVLEATNGESGGSGGSNQTYIDYGSGAGGGGGGGPGGGNCSSFNIVPNGVNGGGGGGGGLYAGKGGDGYITVTYYSDYNDYLQS